MTKAALDNRANQMNPNNWRYWSSRGMAPPAKNGGYEDAVVSSRRGGGYTGLGTKADLDNHANQMNPNNWRYWSSRGVAPPANQGTAVSRQGDGDTDLDAAALRDQMTNWIQANQMDPNSWVYWGSRGMPPPWMHDRCARVGQVVGRRLADGENGADVEECLETDACVCAGDRTNCDLNSDCAEVWSDAERVVGAVFACVLATAESCEDRNDVPHSLWILTRNIGVTVSCILEWILICIFTVQYRRYVIAKKPKILDADAVPDEFRISGRGFRTSITQECFSGVGALACCSEESSMFLHACCCTAVRMSDTYSSAGLGGFCAHVLLAFALRGLAQLGDAVAGGWCLLAARAAMALYFAVLRGRLHRRLGGYSELLTDFCCIFWCAPCVASQEAKQVDGALGVRVECCCVLEQAGQAAVPLVGLPVAMAAESRAPPL